MNYLLLAFSVLVSVSVGISRNKYSKNEIGSQSDLHLLNIVTGLLSVVTLGVIAWVSGGLFLPSGYTVFMGAAYGLATVLGAICTLLALGAGPLSYTTVITSCSMVIPSLSGLWFGETVSVFQYVGIVVMVFSFLLAVDTKSKQDNGANLKWFVCCMLAFICSGSVGVLQKIHQNSSHKQELSMFLIIAFFVSALLSYFIMLYYRHSKHKYVTVLNAGKFGRFLVISLIIGVGFALCNQINMYLSGVMDSIIFFPVVNGGSMIITTAVGLVFFKEKLTQKQMIGLGLGVVAMFLLCNIIRV